MKKYSLIVLSVVLLVGCSKLKYGNVVEKDYHPEWEQVMFFPLIMSNGKTTKTMMIPYFVHHNESWSIDVKGVSTKNKIITKTFYIDKAAYDTLNIGHFICVEGFCDTDTALHKTRQ